MQLQKPFAPLGISVDPEEVIISVNGRRVDGMEASNFFVANTKGTPEDPVKVLLTFPYLPPASAVLADPSLAAWPGAYPLSSNGQSSAADTAGSGALANLYMPTPNNVASAEFHVDIAERNGTTVTFTTTLHKKWLNKPLRQGLVLPALKAYIAQSWQTDTRTLPLEIRVDGLEVDGTAPGSSYIRTDSQITRVLITLPPDALNPTATATAVFHVYIDDTGWTTPSETTLNKKWLVKSLLQAIVEPAVGHHCKTNAVPKVPPDGVTIMVDGIPADGSAPAYTFIKDEKTPVRVDLSLPSRSYTIRRISRR